MDDRLRARSSGSCTAGGPPGAGSIPPGGPIDIAIDDEKPEDQQDLYQENEELKVCFRFQSTNMQQHFKMCLLFSGGNSKAGRPSGVFENLWDAHGEQAHKGQERWTFFQRKSYQTTRSLTAIPQPGTLKRYLG